MSCCTKDFTRLSHQYSLRTLLSSSFPSDVGRQQSSDLRNFTLLCGDTYLINVAVLVLQCASLNIPHGVYYFALLLFWCLVLSRTVFWVIVLLGLKYTWTWCFLLFCLPGDPGLVFLLELWSCFDKSAMLFKLTWVIFFSPFRCLHFFVLGQKWHFQPGGILLRSFPACCSEGCGSHTANTVHSDLVSSKQQRPHCHPSFYEVCLWRPVCCLVCLPLMLISILGVSSHKTHTCLDILDISTSSTHRLATFKKICDPIKFCVEICSVIEPSLTVLIVSEVGVFVNI